MLDLPTETEATEARRDMCRQRLVIAERNATGDLSEDVQMALATCDRPDLSPGDWKALEGLSLRLLLRSIKPVETDEDTHCYSGSYWCNDGPDGFCECDCKGCRS